jgi:hypothetical protein
MSLNVVKEWTCEGYPCLIIKHEYGHLCGYVGLPKEHKLYGKDYDDIYADVHGGVTFAGERRQQADTWFVGFDCAHYGDLVPGLMKSGIYRDEAYVTEQCESLAKQLVQQ